MLTTAIIYNIGRGLAFNVVLPLWCLFNHILRLFWIMGFPAASLGMKKKTSKNM